MSLLENSQPSILQLKEMYNLFQRSEVYSNSFKSWRLIKPSIICLSRESFTFSCKSSVFLQMVSRLHIRSHQLSNASEIECRIFKSSSSFTANSVVAVIGVVVVVVVVVVVAVVDVVNVVIAEFIVKIFHCMTNSNEPFYRKSGNLYFNVNHVINSQKS